MFSLLSDFTLALFAATFCGFVMALLFPSWRPTGK